MRSIFSAFCLVALMIVGGGLLHAQEVTASGMYRGQDLRLSNRVDVLRGLLEATVAELKTVKAEVEKISACNNMGKIYTSDDSYARDAKGCLSPTISGFTRNRSGSCRYKQNITNDCSCPTGYRPFKLSEFQAGDCRYYFDGGAPCGIDTYLCIK